MPKEIINGDLEVTGTFTSGGGSVKRLDPAQITSNLDPFDDAGWDRTVTHLYIGGDAIRAMQGFEVADFVDLDEVIVTNDGAFDMSISHDNAGTAANGVLCDDNRLYAIPPNGSVKLVRDATAARWRLFGLSNKDIASARASSEINTGRRLRPDGTGGVEWADLGVLNDLSDVNVPNPLTLSDNNKHLKAVYITPAEYGTGADADFIGGTTPDPLAYTDLTAGITVGTTILTVRDASTFTVGDEVLIHQTQVGQDTSAANLTKRGQYEYATILAKDDTQPAGLDTLTLDMGVFNAYDSDSNGDKSDNQKAQILKVYNYDNVNLAAGDISAPAWNGFHGGILAFRCSGLLTGGGSIDMIGNGFRGGPATAQGAEGWSGTNASLTNATAIDSGAGGGSTGGGAEPGAGGGHNGAGTDSNGVDASGLDYGLSGLETNINLGGGGSGGNSGGDSGGAIIAFVSDFSGYSGTVNSAGAAAPVAGSDVGGSGGAILFFAPTDFTGTTDVTAGPSFNAGEAVSAPGYETLTQPPTAPIAVFTLSTSVDIWPSDITANRPAAPATVQRFFDTTLGIPIWFDGTNWVDATGSTV